MDASDWRLVCGQNDPSGGYINVNGNRLTVVGGIGTVWLTVNDGSTVLAEGYARWWGVFEIAVWDRYVCVYMYVYVCMYVYMYV